jgi:signal transduction histidine kinase
MSCVVLSLTAISVAHVRDLSADIARVASYGGRAVVGALIMHDASALNRDEFHLAADPSPNLLLTVDKAVMRRRESFHHDIDQLSALQPDGEDVRSLERAYDDYSSTLNSTLEVVRRLGDRDPDPAERDDVLASARISLAKATAFATGAEDYALGAARSAQLEAALAATRGQAIRRQEMLACALCLLIGLSASYAFAKFAIDRPIARIVTCLNRIASESGEIPIYGLERRDEIGQIARALQAFQAAMAQNRSLLADEQRVQRELLEAKSRADAANLAKSTFLANMSHELRTPLNAIIGFSEMMSIRMHGPLGSERYDGYAIDILNSGRWLLGLINDVLDISKIEAGRMTLIPQSVRLSDAVADSCRIIMTEVERRQLRLAQSVHPDLPPARVDPRAIRQVIANLLSNAAKFTESGGHIKVSARQDPSGWLELTVADSGVGIAAEDLARVQRPFEQAGSELIRRSQQGTGLGLPIARSLIELSGGGFRLDSEIGSGTRVTIRLPVAA